MELLIIWVVFIIIGCLLAEAKGQGWGFTLSFLLGPLGVLIILALPNLTREKKEQEAEVLRARELNVQQQMLDELKALRAEKAQREGAAQPAPEWIPRTPPPPVVQPPEDFIPESLQSVRRPRR